MPAAGRQLLFSSNVNDYNLNYTISKPSGHHAATGDIKLFIGEIPWRDIKVVPQQNISISMTTRSEPKLKVFMETISKNSIIHGTNFVINAFMMDDSFLRTRFLSYQTKKTKTI
jgi:hypothetical protein